MNPFNANQEFLNEISKAPKGRLTLILFPFLGIMVLLVTILVLYL